MKNKNKKTLWTILTTILVLSAIGVIAFQFYNPLQTSISNAYHTNLERLSPDYLNTKQLACVDHSGTWKDSRIAVGCFNIGEDWDSKWCLSNEAGIVQDICDGLEGTIWVCDQNNAGCKY